MRRIPLRVLHLAALPASSRRNVHLDTSDAIPARIAAGEQEEA